MTTVERSIYIDAPPDVSFDVGHDAGHWLDWYAGMQSVQPDNVYPAVGSRVDIANKTAGLTLNMTLTVADYVPGQTIAYQVEGMVTGTIQWDYQPDGDGTLVTAHFDYEMPGGALGQIADRLVVERANAANLEASLENLKGLIEG
jgi:uncharacterized membrane protein